MARIPQNRTMWNMKSKKYLYPFHYFILHGCFSTFHDKCVASIWLPLPMFTRLFHQQLISRNILDCRPSPSWCHILNVLSYPFHLHTHISQNIKDKCRLLVLTVFTFRVIIINLPKLNFTLSITSMDWNIFS